MSAKPSNRQNDKERPEGRFPCEPIVKEPAKEAVPPSQIVFHMEGTSVNRQLNNS